MSDEQRQQGQIAQAEAQAAKKTEDRWGDPISEERQAELQGYLDRWQAESDHGERTGPFDAAPQLGVPLTGADVFWLAEQSSDGHGAVPNLHLERVSLFEAHLEGASLLNAHLEGASLRLAHLEGKTYKPDDADFRRIRHWAEDFSATLPGADLREAVLDAATSLKDIGLGDAQRGAVRVADVRWGSANLAVVDWTPLIEPVTQLGDERAARDWKPWPFTPPEGKFSRQEVRTARAKHERQQAADRLEVFRAAVRANRQLATALRDQGLNEEADRFADRAQVVQRQVFHLQNRRGRRAGSWLLDLMAGYGYKPMRAFIAYALVVLGFAAAYLTLGSASGHSLSWNEAIVISMTAFHGRGFFSSVFQPGDLQAAVAAAEAFIGLLIEITFIATFTQRFFAR